MILDYKNAKRDFLAAKIQGCRKFFELNNYQFKINNLKRSLFKQDEMKYILRKAIFRMVKKYQKF